MHNKKNIEKPKNFKASMIKLISYCKPYLVPIIFAILLAIFSSVLTIIGPNKISDLTNEITKGLMTSINMGVVKNISLFLLIIYLFSFAFNYIQIYIMAVITNKFSARLRREISNKINKLPLKYFDTHSYGDILSRVTNDVDTIGQTLNQSVGNLVSSIVLFVGVIFIMFITNPIMALTGILSSIIGFSLNIVILVKSQKYFTSQQKELGNLNGHIEEIYSGLNVVKIYNATTDATKEFDKINEKLYSASRKSSFLSGLMGPIMGFIGNFGYVAICTVGAALVINGKISIGTIVSFMIYVRLFTGPLNTIAQSITSLQSTAAASERVFELLDETELENETGKVKILERDKVKGKIEFINVNFGYETDNKIINNFNAVAYPGQKVAIVGPTGAGKTTMVNLLMRFYEIDSGEIKIDGINIKDIKRENVHDLFCMVLQDTWIFEGSIKENIRYNNKFITDEMIYTACKTVGLDHFIKTLPNGYDTILSETETLSSGQKQLLTIARAMIENAPFIILDEATSSVDTRTEALVQTSMDKLTKGRTSFIIAHRLSTIKNADLILVMKDGKIKEVGNHDSLMKNGKFYAELYNSQFMS